MDGNADPGVQSTFYWLYRENAFDNILNRLEALYSVKTTVYKPHTVLWQKYTSTLLCVRTVH